MLAFLACLFGSVVIFVLSSPILPQPWPVWYWYFPAPPSMNAAAAILGIVLGVVMILLAVVSDRLGEGQSPVIYRSDASEEDREYEEMYEDAHR